MQADRSMDAVVVRSDELANMMRLFGVIAAQALV
jgi:hypothetical protein